MNIQDLEQEIIAFRDARNWQQFHSLKDLLLGLNIEVAELAELFLWKSEAEIAEINANNPHKLRTEVAHELADIYIFLNYLARHFEINLGEAVLHKLQLNAAKYPVEKSYNSNKKYSDL